MSANQYILTSICRFFSLSSLHIWSSLGLLDFMTVFQCVSFGVQLCTSIYAVCSKLLLPNAVYWSFISVVCVFLSIQGICGKYVLFIGLGIFFSSQSTSFDLKLIAASVWIDWISQYLPAQCRNKGVLKSVVCAEYNNVSYLLRYYILYKQRYSLDEYTCITMPSQKLLWETCWDWMMWINV